MSLPSVELLESSHTFPGPYTFKIIGSAEDNFLARVIAAVRHELRVELDPPFRLRSTRGGRHVSITMEPEVESAQQVLAVYSRLSQTSGLVLLM